ncbi:hypothetical protein [Desulfatitalea tepidiphila]|uniref:hypothetical protein n=1 Tax=Desulfatitalea tepidiphila TaxID=1185843 RepID=UPI0006B4B8E7|nr:hypothetical protein [Desulfatitalea tepidiphila]
MIYSLLCSILAVQAACGPEGNPNGNVEPVLEQPVLTPTTVAVGSQKIRFYVDYGSDSAVLGFFVENSVDQRRYFPIYASTYRGVPAVTLELFVEAPHAHEDARMWVRSSWAGYEMLAFHKDGSDRCLTRFGEIRAQERPTPKTLGGETKAWPALEQSQAAKIAILTFDGKAWAEQKLHEK